MPQPDHISRLGVPDPATLDDDLQAIWRKCVEKLGFVPNVFSTYSLKPQRLRNFMAMYNEIMLSASGLSKLEREMVAVVVSSANRCYYCLVAHGAAVRALSGDRRTRGDDGAELPGGEAGCAAAGDAGLRLEDDHDAAWLIEDADRDALRAVGLTARTTFRPRRDGGVLQPVQSDGLGDRHDAEPRVSPDGAIGAAPRVRPPGRANLPPGSGAGRVRPRVAPVSPRRGRPSGRRR